MNITGVILAAGKSTRMGSANKLLLKYKNHTIIEEVLAQLSNSRVENIVVVTGFENDRIEKLLGNGRINNIKIIYNSNFRQGRAESIKCTIEYLSDEVDAALFMVADKPGVNSSLINRAIDCYREKRPAILYIETPSGRGHPIIFSKTLFDELMSLQGDCVGNELIDSHKKNIVSLWDDTPQIDIDNDADYRLLLQNETGVIKP